MVIYSDVFSVSAPIAQALLLAAIGLFWLLLRYYRAGTAFIALGVLWLTACATPAFAGLLLSGLERQYPPQPAADYRTADAIVVLGGNTLPSIKSADNASKLATTRLGFALLLYKSRRAPIIVLSGGGGSALAMLRRLQEFGVPATAIRVDARSTNTYQNAKFSAAILEEEGLHRILLVTSPKHMPRSKASFEEQGLEVIPAASNEKHLKLDSSAQWWPHPSILHLSERILHEYIGLYAYKIRGWA
jgi:uncharacterized SAM-binding protein YcdF (DUF218 family)